jgi:alpha-L-fucosidase
VPKYLEDYRELCEENPRAANQAWFADTKWGLFLHYGLYSQLERGEWVLQKEAIPLGEYEKLFDSFNPEQFDAESITDLALAANMSYITLTACHHEGFCLWNSKVEPWNSYQAVGRDLVRELGEACARKGLGFFLYFTYILNWRHPWALDTDTLPGARPAYAFDEPRYQLRDKSEWGKFWEWSLACINEILKFDFPIAGIWLDIINAYYKLPDLIPVEETYAMIRRKRPEMMIAYKQGATGDEDFATPEFSFHSQGDMLRQQGLPEAAAIADRAWAAHKNKHNEICMTLQQKGWGYVRDAVHYSADEVWGRLAYAISNNCSMLTNTGPLPDGSIHLGDTQVLRELGERIRTTGWPSADEAITPESWSQRLKARESAAEQ